MVSALRVGSALVAMLSCIACGVGGTAAATSTASDVQATLTAVETDALFRGEHVTRTREFERDGKRYVGGVAYQVVEAPPHVVLESVRDAGMLQKMLPRTRRVEPLDLPGPRRLAVQQGNDFVQAEYTVILEEVPSQNEVRFYMDEARPHDIDDVYGYFRAAPLDGGRTLVTVGVALDLGPGLVRMLFEEKIQRMMLGTPRRMRDVIEHEHAARGMLARGGR